MHIVIDGLEMKMEFNLNFFRKKEKNENWFEELDQIINRSVEDCSISNLDFEFRRQPGLIAYWSFVLSELIFVKEQLSREILELESKLVKDVISKGTSVNLTYRILDLICASNQVHRRLNFELAKVCRGI